jgi:hypothetical protein
VVRNFAAAGDRFKDLVGGGSWGALHVAHPFGDVDYFPGVGYELVHRLEVFGVLRHLSASLRLQQVD